MNNKELKSVLQELNTLANTTQETKNNAEKNILSLVKKIDTSIETIDKIIGNEYESIITLFNVNINWLKLNNLNNLADYLQSMLDKAHLEGETLFGELICLYHYMDILTYQLEHLNTKTKRT